MESRELVREIELDAPADDVWGLVSDPDELAGWVGEEVRGARFAQPADAERRQVRWSWAPDGVPSEVELTLTDAGARTLVRVVERPSVPTALACRCATERWDGALVVLELWALGVAAAVRA